MLYRYVNLHTDIRNSCGTANTIADFRALIHDIRQRVTAEEAEAAEVVQETISTEQDKKDKYWISWYNRHRYESENGEERKPIVTKDDLLNLKTSFLRACDQDMWCVGDDGESCGDGGGIFGGMFAADE